VREAEEKVLWKIALALIEAGANVNAEDQVRAQLTLSLFAEDWPKTDTQMLRIYCVEEWTDPAAHKCQS
jgi:hypothetical protein